MHSQVIRELIKRRFGAAFMSIQRPLLRAYEPNPEAAKQWLEVEYPENPKKMAPTHRAFIFFEDESGTDQINIQERRGLRVAKHPSLSGQGSA